ncbi:MAG: hypothetical protein RLP44_19535 [Aggregatilineales bacterium]
MGRKLLQIIEKAMSGVTLGVILALAVAIVLSIFTGIFYLLTGQGGIKTSAGASIYMIYILAFYFVLPVGVFGGFIFGLISGINNPERRELSPPLKSLLSNALTLIIGYAVLCALFFLIA